jgi:hypothetical protein
MLAEWIGDPSIPVTPKHILDGHVHAGAALDCETNGFVHVFHVYVEVRGNELSIGRCRRGFISDCVIDEYIGVTDLYVGMHDLIVWTRHAVELNRAKNVLVKLNGARGVPKN